MPRRSLPWRHDNITPVHPAPRPPATSADSISISPRHSLNVRLVSLVPPYVAPKAKASSETDGRRAVRYRSLTCERVRRREPPPALWRDRSGRICPAVEGGDRASIAFAQEERVLRPFRAARPKRGRGG